MSPGDASALLAAIVSSSDDAIIAKDRDGIVTFWNPAAERLYGWAPDEIIGRPVSVIVPEGRRGEEQELLARALAGERVEHDRTERLRKDGSVVWVSVTVSPIQVGSGDIVGASVISRDLTAAMPADALATELLDSAPDAMIVVDGTGRIVHTNRQAYVLFGYEPGALIGHTVEDLVPAHLRERHRSHRAGFAHDPVVRPMGANLQELVALRADGSEFPVEISLSPVVSWRGPLTVAAIRDATARKQLDRLKDEFLSTVSHELRTPVSAIGGFAELLHQYGDELDDDRRDELLRRIISNSHEMHGMVEQLLDYSRLAAGRVSINPVRTPLPDAVHAVLGAHERTLARHRVEVDVDPHVHVEVDRVGFGRILGNFLTNAAKFSEPGTTITVQGKAHDGAVHVAVVDEGVGIPPEDVGRVFERFFQSSSRTTVRGTGIGLSIAARYAEMHGGRVDASSRLGEGSTFTVILPASRSRAAVG